MRKTSRSTYSALGGDVFTAFLGLPENPLSDDALCENFRACTAFAGWSEKRTNSILDNLRNIVEPGAISSLMRGEP